MNQRDRTEFVVTPDSPISDIDLATEEFILADGSRLTERRAARIAREALAKKRAANLRPGRKSLAGDGSHSPVVQFRTPRRDEAEKLAQAQHISLSELARRAFDLYLDQQR